MNNGKKIQIMTDEVFETLAKAPIVEAIIDIRALPKTVLEEAALRTHLEPVMKDYQFLDSLRNIQHEVKIEPGKIPSQTVQDLGWKGVRFQSLDSKHITQFNRDGFVFSRLAPYVDWKCFTTEGLKLWNVFRELAKPDHVYRIGLRFINRIVLPAGELLFENYIHPAPESPRGLDLPFLGYVHQDMFAVPGHPYAMNVIQTIQPPQPPMSEGVSLILDIDVYTIQDFPLQEAEFDRRLVEMRWLKDKAFFGSITDKAKEMFR